MSTQLPLLLPSRKYTKNRNRERAEDEKAVNKLFKDITNGGLRRKRTGAADFDLSDSDDDGEARRRHKQLEFAKMRKALLENENVGKIAEDPKKLAFLRAIEDRDEGEEALDFLANPAEASFVVENVDSQPLPELVHAIAPRLPAAQRRTPAHTKKPATLADIRDSVSFLVEDPGSVVRVDPSSSADEEEPAIEIAFESRPSEASLEDTLPDLDSVMVQANEPVETFNASTAQGDSQEIPAESMAPPGRPNPRRTAAKPVIDRIMLKRQSSSSHSHSSSSSLAFCNAEDQLRKQSFVPSLLRRATTSSLMSESGTNHAATERSAGGKEQGEYVKRGGRKGSSINAFGKRLESQKALIVDRAERRRRAEKEQLANRRSGLISLSRVVSWD